MAELPPRKELILRAVIVEYVTGAEPVASELLTVKYDLGVKSATVRNELAEMSDLGFLEQPHTSAGRIPSDRGYRYYIDHLVRWQEPSQAERDRLRGASEEGDALQHLLQQTTRALSRVTHLLAAATTFRGGSLSVKSAIVSAFGPQQALVVLGLSNGEVQNRLIECPSGLTLQDVGAVNEALTLECVGKPLRSIGRSKMPQIVGTPTSASLMQATWAALRSMSREWTRGTLTTHGEEFLFGQPEFQREPGQLSGLLEQLKESDVLFETLALPSDSPTTVTIGKEHKREELHKLSVVRQVFYVGDAEAGTIAVIGPTRLNYDSNVPLIQFTARALSDALTRYVGK